MFYISGKKNKHCILKIGTGNIKVFKPEILSPIFDFYIGINGAVTSQQVHVAMATVYPGVGCSRK